MKKLILIPILLIVALSSQAQERKSHQRNITKQSAEQITPERRAELMTKRMTEQLSLTKEQQEKIHQLSLEQAKQHAEQAKLSKEKAETIKAERIKNREEIEKVLTPEQRTKWEEAKNKQTKSRRMKSGTSQKDFKRKGSMNKKVDSTGSKKPVRNITPITTEAQ